MNGLRHQDRLDGASNFVIWKARILAVLDEHHIKDHALNTIVIPFDANPLKKYEEAQDKAKRMIMDEVKDHVIPHIVKKNTTREMWTSLTSMYQGTFVQLKMLLEDKLRLFHMQKGEETDPYLSDYERSVIIWLP